MLKSRNAIQIQENLGKETAPNFKVFCERYFSDTGGKTGGSKQKYRQRMVQRIPPHDRGIPRTGEWFVLRRSGVGRIILRRTEEKEARRGQTKARSRSGKQSAGVWHQETGRRQSIHPDH